MAKSAALGCNLYVAGYELSGDISTFGARGGPALLDSTGIDRSANERLGGLRDGGIDFTAFFNPATTRAHPRLASLPTTDVIVSVGIGTTLGDHGVACTAKQANYDGKRGADGAFMFGVAAQSSATGVEWGLQGTAGIRTDTTATNGASIDNSAAFATTAFGLQAYLHVFAFTGTSVTAAVQDSADNSAFAAVTGGAFTAATGITSQRIATSNTLTIRRYLRVVTTGTFSNAQFAVLLVRNDTATAF